MTLVKTQMPKSIADRMQTAKSASESIGLNMLLVGRKNAGKTVLMSTAQDTPLGKDLLVLDVEKGLKPIEHRDDIAVWTIDSTDELDDIVPWLAAGKHSFRTIALDSLSALEDMSLNEVMSIKEDRVVKNSRKDDVVKLPQPTQADYGDANRKVLKCAQKLRQLSIVNGWTVIMLCRVYDYLQRIPDGQGGTTGVRVPDITLREGVLKSLTGDMDMITLIKEGPGERRSLQFKAVGEDRYMKTRHSLAAKRQYPREMQDPTMHKVLSIAKGLDE